MTACKNILFPIGFKFELMFEGEMGMFSPTHMCINRSLSQSLKLFLADCHLNFVCLIPYYLTQGTVKTIYW